MITNLINDLLDLAKFENSVFKIDEDYFNLIEVITEAFNIVAYSAEEKNIKLFLQFDSSKPFILTRVLTDRKRLLQILINIMSNSLKFVERDTGYLNVKLKILKE
jgi:signal transduction histidine kinase